MVVVSKMHLTRVFLWISNKHVKSSQFVFVLNKKASSILYNNILLHAHLHFPTLSCVLELVWSGQAGHVYCSDHISFVCFFCCCFFSSELSRPEALLTLSVGGGWLTLIRQETCDLSGRCPPPRTWFWKKNIFIWLLPPPNVCGVRTAND